MAEVIWMYKVSYGVKVILTSDVILAADVIQLTAHFISVANSIYLIENWIFNIVNYIDDVSDIGGIVSYFCYKNEVVESCNDLQQR